MIIDFSDMFLAPYHLGLHRVLLEHQAPTEMLGRFDWRPLFGTNCALRY